MRHRGRRAARRERLARALQEAEYEEEENLDDGGGFLVGGLESHDDICAEICDFAGSRVLSLDYSLAPEHKYPQFYSDSIRFYYFIKNSKH